MIFEYYASLPDEPIVEGFRIRGTLGGGHLRKFDSINCVDPQPPERKLKSLSLEVGNNFRIHDFRTYMSIDEVVENILSPVRIGHLDAGASCLRRCIKDKSEQ